MKIHENDMKVKLLCVQKEFEPKLNRREGKEIAFAAFLCVNGKRTTKEETRQDARLKDLPDHQRIGSDTEYFKSIRRTQTDVFLGCARPKKFRAERGGETSAELPEGFPPLLKPPIFVLAF
jgi:hypothetical protein